MLKLKAPSFDRGAPMWSYVVKTSAVFSLTVAATLLCHAQGNGNPRLNLTVSPSERTLTAGGSTSFDIGVKGVGNFNGPVNLGTEALPSGVSVRFSPSPLDVKNGREIESTAWVTVANTVAQGRYPIYFVADGGSVSDSATAVLIVSSGGGGTTTSFDFNVSPGERTVAKGNQTDFNLSLSMSGAGTSTVNLSLKSPPSGISAVFTPSSSLVVTGGSSSSATATVKVDNSVPSGDYQIVLAADSSTTHRERQVVLHVPGADAGTGTFDFDVSPGFRTLLPSTTLPFTLTLGSRNGFQGMVNLSASGLPSGATVAFQPGGSIAMTQGSTALVTAMITTGPAALTGNFQVRFSADSGAIHRERTVVLGASAASDVELEVVPGTQSITSGGAAKFALVLVPKPGFTGTVKLGIGQLPQGAIAAFDPSDLIQLSGGTSSVVNLTVQTAAGTAAGDFPLIISADTGVTSQQKTVMLKVLRIEDFTLSATPLTRTVPQGGAASYELTLASPSQFSGTVEVVAGSLPPGVTAYFTPDNTTVLTAGGSAKLIATLVTDGATPSGSYTVAFTGKSGGIERTTMVRLGIEGSLSFNFTAAPLLRLAAPGSNTAFSFTLTSLNNFAGPVNITTGALPAGVTVTLAPVSPIALQAGQAIPIMAQVSIAPSVPAGKYPLRFTASSASSSNDALVLLWVTTDQGFYLDATPDLRETSPGNSANYTLRLTSIGNFSGAVQLAAQGLPAGAAAVFQQNALVNLSAGQIQTIGVTVTTAANTPLGAANFKFTADTAVSHKEDTVTLNVVPNSGYRIELAPSSRTAAPGGSATYNLTIWSFGGFAGPVDLNISDLPSGFTAALDPGSRVQLEAGGVEVVQFVVSVPADAAPGTRLFQVNALGNGQAANATGRLVVSAQNAVRLSLSPTERTVPRGEAAVFAVTVTSDAYQGPVMLRTVGLPTGATIFSAPTNLMIKPGQSIELQFSVTPGSTSSLGLYNFAVVADTSVPRVAEAFGKLTVVASQETADFSVMIMPSSRTVNSGSTAVYKVLVTSLNGFRGSVDLSVLGFSEGNVKWEGSDSIFLEAGETRTVTLLVKTEKGAEEKLYRLLFAADSGTTHHEVMGSMTVVKTSSDDEDENGDDHGHNN